MSRNTGISSFIEKHFFKILELRNKGYRWKQIIPELGLLYSKQMETSLIHNFKYIRKRKHPDELYLNKRNHSIASFVQEKFDRIHAMRASGFSWAEIVEKFFLYSRFPLSMKLADVVRNHFNKIKRNRRHKK